MCTSTPDVDDKPRKLQMDAADEARAREQARQARIADGRSFLDAVFRGGDYTDRGTTEVVNVGQDKAGKQDFEFRWTGGTGDTQTFAGYDPYLDDLRSTLGGYYRPQLRDQHDDAEDQLKYGLARAGMSASSQGAEDYADLTNTFDLRRNEMLSEIDSQVQGRRAEFERTRGALEDMLMQTGDASRMANEATTQIDQLYRKQPEVNPLGDMFVNAVSTYGQYGAGRRAGRVAGIYDQPSIVDRAPSSGTFIQ